MLRRPRHPGPRLDGRRLATTWQVVSLLLDYPTEELVGRRGVLEEAAAGLSAAVREPVCRFLGVLGSVPLGQRGHQGEQDVVPGRPLLRQGDPQHLDS